VDLYRVERSEIPPQGGAESSLEFGEKAKKTPGFMSGVFYGYNQSSIPLKKLLVQELYSCTKRK